MQAHESCANRSMDLNKSLPHTKPSCNGQQATCACQICQSQDCNNYGALPWLHHDQSLCTCCNTYTLKITPTCPSWPRHWTWHQRERWSVIVAGWGQHLIQPCPSAPHAPLPALPALHGQSTSCNAGGSSQLTKTHHT